MDTDYFLVFVVTYSCDQNGTTKCYSMGVFQLTFLVPEDVARLKVFYVDYEYFFLDFVDASSPRSIFARFIHFGGIFIKL